MTGGTQNETQKLRGDVHNAWCQCGILSKELNCS